MTKRQPGTPKASMLTLTYELGDQSIEAATALIDRWLEGELKHPRRLRPKSIVAIDLDPGDAIPEPARRIAARRRKLHLTQEDLAKLAGVTRVTVARVELGAVSPTSTSAIAIRDALARAEATR